MSAEYKRNLEASGWTALMWSALMGHACCTREMLSVDRGLVNATNKDKQNALHLASMRGKDECVRELLTVSAKSQVRAKDGNGMTPLMLAAFNAHPECVKALITTDTVIQLMQHDVDGWTALTWAAAMPQTEDPHLKKRQIACVVAILSMARQIFWWAMEENAVPLKCGMFLVYVMKDAKGMAIRNDHADVARILDNEITKAECALAMIQGSMEEEYNTISAEVESYIKHLFLFLLPGLCQRSHVLRTFSMITRCTASLRHAKDPSLQISVSHRMPLTPSSDSCASTESGGVSMRSRVMRTTSTFRKLLRSISTSWGNRASLMTTWEVGQLWICRRICSAQNILCPNTAFGAIVANSCCITSVPNHCISVLGVTLPQRGIGTSFADGSSTSARDRPNTSCIARFNGPANFRFT